MAAQQQAMALQQQRQRELAWYRAQLQQQEQAKRQAEQQAFEAQTADLSEEQYQVAVMQRELEQARARENQVQQYVQRQQLGGYYQQFAPQEIWGNAQSPEMMGHNTLVHLHRQNQQLQQELAALKKASTAPPAAPVTSTTPAQPPVTKGVWDLTWDEINDRREAAARGMLRPTADL
jgi:hypothetical protein